MCPTTRRSGTWRRVSPSTSQSAPCSSATWKPRRSSSGSERTTRGGSPELVLEFEDPLLAHRCGLLPKPTAHHPERIGQRGLGDPAQHLLGLEGPPEFLDQDLRQLQANPRRWLGH